MNLKATLTWDRVELASQLDTLGFLSNIVERTQGYSIIRLKPNPHVLERQSIAMVPLAEASLIEVRFDVVPVTVDGTTADEGPHWASKIPLLPFGATDEGVDVER